MHRAAASTIYSLEEEDIVPRLLLFARNELHVPDWEIDALIRRTIAEVIRGDHDHHFRREPTTFRSLCAALQSVLAAQREPQRGAGGRT